MRIAVARQAALESFYYRLRVWNTVAVLAFGNETVLVRMTEDTMQF